MDGNPTHPTKAAALFVIGAWIVLRALSFIQIR